MQEIWKDVVGCEGIFIVSSIGTIKNLIKSKVVIQKKDRQGYLRIASRIGKNKTCSAHRIVAFAFIPNPMNKPQINHINGIKDDNRVENLEWATSHENLIHAFKTGLKVSATLGKFGSDNPKSKPISQYKLDGTFIESFLCVKDANEKTGINITNIRDCALGNRPRAGWYSWKYDLKKKC